jgi:hypothetical protein
MKERASIKYFVRKGQNWWKNQKAFEGRGLTIPFEEESKDQQSFGPQHPHAVETRKSSTDTYQHK